MIKLCLIREPVRPVIKETEEKIRKYAHKTDKNGLRYYLKTLFSLLFPKDRQ